MEWKGWSDERSHFCDFVMQLFVIIAVVVISLSNKTIPIIYAFYASFLHSKISLKGLKMNKAVKYVICLNYTNVIIINLNFLKPFNSYSNVINTYRRFSLILSSSYLLIIHCCYQHNHISVIISVRISNIYWAFTESFFIFFSKKNNELTRENSCFWVGEFIRSLCFRTVWNFVKFG